MRVQQTSVKHLPLNLYKKMANLNHRFDGSMQDRLYVLRNPRLNEEGIVHYLLDGDKLIGWTLLFKKTRRSWLCHIYVRKSERRKGYGKRLLRANLTYCKRKNRRLIVCWDDQKEFFDACQESYPTKFYPSAYVY